MIEKGGLPIELIIGPCSINESNVEDVFKLSEIQVKNLRGQKQSALFGTRVVGLKSRTELNESGEGMGMDFKAVMQNLLILENGGNINDFVTPPSVNIGKDIIDQTGMMIATEVMMPFLQVPVYDRQIQQGKMLLWSPSVETLGWSILPTADVVAKRQDWRIGIKNPKWLGNFPVEADNLEAPETSMEKTWKGMAGYALARGDSTEQIVMIHRGIDVPEKGDFRSLPVHKVAERTKLTMPRGVKIYFDPSHSFGPKKRDEILEATIQAMLMKDGRNDWLYDGALIEAGNSTTDTGQHMTIDEVVVLASELAKFRNLRVPSKP